MQMNRWSKSSSGRFYRAKGRLAQIGCCELCYGKLLMVGLLSQDDCCVYVPKGKWVQG